VPFAEHAKLASLAIDKLDLIVQRSLLQRLLSVRGEVVLLIQTSNTHRLLAFTEIQVEPAWQELSVQGDPHATAGFNVGVGVGVLVIDWLGEMKIVGVGVTAGVFFFDKLYPR